MRRASESEKQKQNHKKNDKTNFEPVLAWILIFQSDLNHFSPFCKLDYVVVDKD